MGKLHKTISKAQIQYVQALRHRLGINDDLYTEIKRSVGVESTRDLTNKQFDELLRRLNGTLRRKSRPAGGDGKDKGSWKPVHRSAYKSGMHRKPAPDKEAMIRKIEAILTELRLPWSYADGIAKQMTGIDRLRWCDGDQTYKVLQALTVHQKRRRKPV